MEEIQFSPHGDLGEIARSEADMRDAASLIEKWRQRLFHVEQALQRIKEGTYGTCIKCHRKIPATRIFAWPVVDKCLLCEADIETIPTGFMLESTRAQA